MSLNRKMGDAHERDLVELLGGRKTRASGAVWKDQMDGRHNRRDVPFAFAWDGKSTRGKSIGITREMWDKAREQAAGERPLLPLRWYDNERLDVGEDLVVLGLHDFAEMLEAANRSEPVVEEATETIRVIASTRRRPEPEEEVVGPLVRVYQPYPRPLMFRGDEVIALDEMWITVDEYRSPTYEFRHEGQVMYLPESARIEIYVDNMIRFLLLPGRHSHMIREEL